MPYVNIQITREGATQTQKAEIIRRTTRMLEEVLHKAPASTFVVIQEIDTGDWGVGGDTVTVRRAREAGGER